MKQNCRYSDTMLKFGPDRIVILSIGMKKQRRCSIYNFILVDVDASTFCRWTDLALESYQYLYKSMNRMNVLLKFS